MPNEIASEKQNATKSSSRWKRWAVAAAIGLSIGWLIDPFLSPPDTAAYFSWGWSGATDADFSFGNEFATFHFKRYFVWLTENTRLANDWPIGSGLAWLPVMAPAAWLERALGMDQITGSDRFVQEWQPGPLTISLLLAWTTLLTLFVFRWATDQGAAWFGRSSARWGAWVTLVGTPFFFYLLFGPFFSHTLSFAASGVFLLLWIRWRGRWTAARSVALGVTAGWMACVRPQSALFVLVVPIEEILRWMGNRRTSGESTEREADKEAPGPHEGFVLMDPRGWPLLGWMVGAAVLGFLPQMIAWWRLYGTPFALPKIEEMHWLKPAILNMLISDYHGILAYTPAMGLVAFGLWFLAKKTKGIGVALTVVFLLQVYVNAANMVWWSSGSFGNRRLVDATAIVLWSLAALWGMSMNRRTGGKHRGWYRALAAVAILGCTWSVWLAAAERLQLLTLDHYVPFNKSFWNSIVKVWTEPGRLVRWVVSTRGVGWEYRLFTSALIAAGWIGMEGWLERLRQPARETRAFAGAARGRMKAPGIAFASIASAFAAAALVFSLRTPKVDISWFQGPAPRQNAVLTIPYFEYGYYLLLHDKPDEAMALFRKAERLRHGDLTSRRWIAIAYRAKKKWRKAAAILDDLLHKYPKDVATQTEATRLLNLWAEDEPHSPEPWLYDSRWLQLEGNPEKAEEYLREAEKRQPPGQPLPSIDTPTKAQPLPREGS